MQLLYAILAFTLLFVINTFICMLSWNYVMPTIFSLPEIDFWQAFALVVLARSFVYSKTFYSKNKEN